MSWLRNLRAQLAVLLKPSCGVGVGGGGRN